MGFDVFISYSSKDKTIADATCAELESGGIRCWIAPRDITPGDEWSSSIIRAIDSCGAMVLIFSSNANESRQIRREVERAVNRGVPIVPMRVEMIMPTDAMAYFMSSVHWLDAITPPLERHLKRLSDALRALLSVEREKSSGRDIQAVANGAVDDRAAILPSRPKVPGRRFVLLLSVGLAVVIGTGAALLYGSGWIWPHRSPPFAANGPPETLPIGAVASLSSILEAAQKGDPKAENTMGVKFAAGEDGLPHDDSKAVEWYRKSALQGLANAQTNLGDMYFFGRGGLDQDYQAALSWYLKAASQNFPDAEYRLGYMYEKGLGTDQDIQHAVKLYRDAASAGYPDAENLLGVLLATGADGVARDDNEAILWYRKAAQQGLAKAQKNLGDMYFFGHGVETNYQQAMVWYTKAADQQFADAQFRLGYMREKGLGAEESVDGAVDLYRKAARNGSVEAQRALDRLNVKSGP